MGKKAPSEYTVCWQVPYEKGELKIVGFDENGVRYEAVKRSFSDSSRLVLTPEKDEINADGEEIVVVIISAQDENGNPVENARDRVEISVEGGRLLGFDNGDSTDYDSYKSSSRRLFSGKAAAYIAAPTESGDITVYAEAQGMKGARTVIKAKSSPVREGISVIENAALHTHNIDNEMLIRKIQLHRSGSGILTPDCKMCRVEAEILPPNATLGDICWSVITDSGIVSNIAQVEVSGKTAVISALGDGSFRLRCSASNGRAHPEVLSEYEFTSEGFGQVSADPFSFIAACLYNYSLVPMDEVREGGVGINHSNNIVGFTKVDFGRYGSDEFSVKMINWHSDAPFGFSLWRGIPHGVNSELLGSFTYQADFEWQTYKENRYTLAETISGIQDIYFEFDKNDFRIDFGGFVFTPNLKAYQRINAAENSLVHGDAFEISGDSVIEIGNNVFIDFSDMSFEKGTSEIVVNGRTRHDNDSVHICFAMDDGRIFEEIMEFPYSEGYTDVRLKLPYIQGKGTVRFKFLPGCDFDFGSFRIIP